MSGAVQIGVETMMHLTCTNMPEEKLSDALTKVPMSLGRTCGRALQAYTGCHPCNVWGAASCL